MGSVFSSSFPLLHLILVLAYTTGSITGSHISRLPFNTLPTRHSFRPIQGFMVMIALCCWVLRSSSRMKISLRLHDVSTFSAHSMGFCGFSFIGVLLLETQPLLAASARLFQHLTFSFMYSKFLIIGLYSHVVRIHGHVSCSYIECYVRLDILPPCT